ncbi:MAG TPA: UDP-glucose--hexose-1-phosphate uridylyltransferase [Patescibacteria group bacterium]|nr:UDP-glucose--hexose-1-phosphate uridylyltransferase [Patescibacteria group bacterium]
MLDTFDGAKSHSINRRTKRHPVSTLSDGERRRTGVERVDFSLPHRRYNPLTGDWILVSPQRTKRPWQGSIEAVALDVIPDYDPACYLCPGNTRASGQVNENYTGTFVFTNDHPSLLPDPPPGTYKTGDLMVAQQERGTSRVVCYTPHHNRTMAQMNEQEIVDVIKTWEHEYETIGDSPNISYVQIFENKGGLMGPSSPHPHSQIWANEHLPTIIQKEQTNQKQFLKNHNEPLLPAYLREEMKEDKRIVLENQSFVCLVPFWATWPYETMILPKEQRQSLSDLNRKDQRDLAGILLHITRRYDNLFNTPFPYSMGIHQKPTDKKPHGEWQFHMHFYPPLLRSATVKKHYVGYEMFAEGQRDISPEAAAATLRGLHE